MPRGESAELGEKSVAIYAIKRFAEVRSNHIEIMVIIYQAGRILEEKYQLVAGGLISNMSELLSAYIVTFLQIALEAAHCAHLPQTLFKQLIPVAMQKTLLQ